jgi:hypothetical protein
MTDADIYEPYDRLVTIKILGRIAEVPENNILLRCLQFISPHTVPFGNFCWNADCHNCEVRLRRNGTVESALCCQTVVREGDEIVELGPETEYVLWEWLRS